MVRRRREKGLGEERAFLVAKHRPMRLNQREYDDQKTRVVHSGGPFPGNNTERRGKRGR